MFRIADLNFGRSTADCWYEFEHEGRRFEVQQFGANFSMPYFRDLMVTLRNQVDAFAITNMAPVVKFKGKRYVHPHYLEVMNLPASVPICDGWRAREASCVNAMVKLIASNQVNPRQGIFFPMAVLHLEIVNMLAAKYARHLFFGDAFPLAKVPLVTTPDSALINALPLVLNLATVRKVESQTPIAKSRASKLTRAIFRAQLNNFQYVVGDPGALLLWDEELAFIEGKDVILTYNNPTLEAEIRKFEPRSVLSLFPKDLQLSPFMNYSVLDAVMMLARGRSTPFFVEEWEKMLGGRRQINPESRRYFLGSKPSAQYRVSTALHTVRKRILTSGEAPDFAFIVHALSKRDLFRIPGLGMLNHAPEAWKDGIEKFAAKAPGFTYGHIRRIISRKTNAEINGIIYGLSATPKMLKQADPEDIYRKIERLCEHAHGMGAKIIGLGAYTKIVGDSGLTINRNSPIPVTTGNSLSASATLWALHEVARKMALIRPLPGSQRLDGMATVIGATGSIGKVSAKLLSLVFKRLCIVAPREDRLSELAAELRALSPECEVSYTTHADEVAVHSDVLVTATSAFDQKIVDVELLKPGCVVCDCSRPLDFTAADAMKRPDILIIESGEVVLPGPVEMSCDIGLPKNVVYACLAETAVLAMEGIHEPFTLGREIDWIRVKRIYQLAIEHGVKLAAIRGHAGLITDREIALARNLALKKLGRT